MRPRIPSRLTEGLLYTPLVKSKKSLLSTVRVGVNVPTWTLMARTSPSKMLLVTTASELVRIVPYEEKSVMLSTKVLLRTETDIPRLVWSTA